MGPKIETLRGEDVTLAAMAVDDARKALQVASGKVRLDAIDAVRSCGKSLREASMAVDHVLLYDIRP